MNVVRVYSWRIIAYVLLYRLHVGITSPSSDFNDLAFNRAFLHLSD